MFYVLEPFYIHHSMILAIWRETNGLSTVPHHCIEKTDGSLEHLLLSQQTSSLMSRRFPLISFSLHVCEVLTGLTADG